MTSRVDRVFDAIRDRRAFDIDPGNATASDLTSLHGHRYLVLVTFRRNGEPVPTPVWFALDADRVYVKTSAASGKVARLGRDPRVLMAASTRRGRPVGPVIDAVGGVLPADEWPRAEASLRAAHGVVRWISERTVGATAPVAYLDIRPARGHRDG
jgi:hypothetical protein